jgi:hypothetical protein
MGSRVAITAAVMRVVGCGGKEPQPQPSTEDRVVSPLVLDDDHVPIGEARPP